MRKLVLVAALRSEHYSCDATSSRELTKHHSCLSRTEMLQIVREERRKITHELLADYSGELDNAFSLFSEIGFVIKCMFFNLFCEDSHSAHPATHVYSEASK